MRSPNGSPPISISRAPARSLSEATYIDALRAELGRAGGHLIEAGLMEAENGRLRLGRRGFMVGIQLAEFPLDARMGHRVTLEARARGAIVRPLGDTVVLMPPLSIAPAELRRLVEITGAAITAAAEAPLAAAA
jgi:adenosylmethionine-8-amino-7-oxononanoate aminotransferase